MTSMTLEPAEILKTDSRGRVRIPKEKREKILSEFDQCGVSAAKFAEIAGVKYQTLMTWLKKHRPKKSRTVTAPVQWFETVVNPGPATPAPGSRLVVHFPDGMKLELGELAQIELAAALIRALRKSC